MDLQRVVGRRPGHPRPQKLGHAGLQIAAPAVILGPCRVIGELPCHHDFDRHHRQLARNPGKLDQRLAELPALQRISQPFLQRRLRHPDGARGGLDARTFEGLHQLLEALPLFPAQQVCCGHAQAVEGQLVLLHAAVAQHLDLAAGDALVGKGVFLCPRGLFRQKHAQAPPVGAVGIGARQERHDIGAGSVRDPGLAAGDHVILALAHRPGAQAAQIRAGVGLGEHRRRQNLGAGDLRQPVRLLRFGASRQDQLGGDLRSGAQAAHPDIAARKLFGDHHHRGLGQAEAPELLGDGQAEHPHPGQLLDDLHRDQLVAQVPAVGIGDHPLLRIAAELLADHFQLVVQPGGAEGGMARPLAHQRNQTAARRLAVAMAQQRKDCRGAQHLVAVIGQDVVQAGHLALAHGDAAGDLGEIFPEGDLKDQLLHLAELPRLLQTLGPGLHLAKGLHIGGQPRKRVGGGLMGLQPGAGDAAIFAQALAQRGGGAFKHRLHRPQGGGCQHRQLGQQGIVHGSVPSVMGHCASPVSQASPG